MAVLSTGAVLVLPAAEAADPLPGREPGTGASAAAEAPADAAAPAAVVAASSPELSRNRVTSAGPQRQPPPSGTRFAVLRIARLGAHWRQPVLEGVGERELARGVGHYPGTALPGSPGNVVLAGHRVTHGHPFRRLDRLRVGDRIVVQAGRQRWQYRVSHPPLAVPTTRTDLLDPRGGHELTLTTCHPPGSARQRLVVRARLAN